MCHLPAVGDSYRNIHFNSYALTDACQSAYQYTDQHAHQYIYRYSHVYSDRKPNRNLHSWQYSDCFAHANGNLIQYTNRDSHADRIGR